ncbi:MAG: response regulator transcription factor [Chitinophagaceae bacterium]|nr:MAG: response regulator transcription factor [Chitinophagaceae bacterium]
MHSTKNIKIGLIDDHQLFLRSCQLMLRSFSGEDYIFNVAFEALNGALGIEKLQSLSPDDLPDIILIDVNMPVMNGIEATKVISRDYPSIKICALSMNDNDAVIIDIIKAGACAYFLKEMHPDELEQAIKEIYEKGFYNADASNINFRRLLQREKESVHISDKEKQFLRHSCSDLTYKEIAALMSLSERTIEAYRETLFKKLNVSSRVGLAMESIRRGLVNL